MVSRVLSWINGNGVEPTEKLEGTKSGKVVGDEMEVDGKDFRTLIHLEPSRANWIFELRLQATEIFFT